MNQHSKMDPILVFLMGGVVFFSLMLLLVEWQFKDDSQIFQVFAQLLSGFGGALLIRVKGGGEDIKPGVTREVSTNVSVTTPEEPKTTG